MCCMRLTPTVLFACLVLGSGCLPDPAASPANSTPQRRMTMANPPSDRDQVAQLVLDLDDLQPYYHVKDVPGRRPLVIRRTEPVNDRPSLTKFGEPVRYEDEPGDAPFFEFVKIALDGDTADVEFRYPVEGLVGEAHLKKVGGTWKVESHTLTES